MLDELSEAILCTFARVQGLPVLKEGGLVNLLSTWMLVAAVRFCFSRCADAAADGCNLLFTSEDPELCRARRLLKNSAPLAS